MKRFIAEALGTAVLVLVGCGSVVAVNLLGSGLSPAVAMGASVHTQGILAIALAFGLSVTAMAYCIGPISGCHINPAVTVALWTAGRFSGKDVPGYLIAQFVGGFVGAGVLALILQGAPGGYAISGGVFGQTTFGAWSPMSALLTEAVATFIFTAVILGVTQPNVGGGALAGLVIGLTLALLHLAFVPITGNSLNPARTLAPNLYAGGAAAAQIWVYFVGPLVGAALAGLAFKSGILSGEK
ncbi:aquaporin [Alsobacter metallidurans]|uniref:Aquaporin n=1 Tax=Alsobacter metallidurans TaxID=340221 RepID=A0A917I681_9HYPH|nr:MIP family channel protein [Alsobacter metallidurans]GGH14011.1 aquaporin [Alsobacter metallidurans]